MAYFVQCAVQVILGFRVDR